MRLFQCKAYCVWSTPTSRDILQIARKVIRINKSGFRLGLTKTFGTHFRSEIGREKLTWTAMATFRYGMLLRMNCTIPHDASNVMPVILDTFPGIFSHLITFFTIELRSHESYMDDLPRPNVIAVAYSTHEIKELMQYSLSVRVFHTEVSPKTKQCTSRRLTT